MESGARQCHAPALPITAAEVPAVTMRHGKGKDGKDTIKDTLQTRWSVNTKMEGIRRQIIAARKWDP